jgi:hypothetical protein
VVCHFYKKVLSAIKETATGVEQTIQRLKFVAPFGQFFFLNQPLVEKILCTPLTLNSHSFFVSFFFHRGINKKRKDEIAYLIFNMVKKGLSWV